jgi:hypothetical protein
VITFVEGARKLFLWPLLRLALNEKKESYLDLIQNAITRFYDPLSINASLPKGISKCWRKIISFQGSAQDADKSKLIAKISDVLDSDFLSTFRQANEVRRDIISSYRLRNVGKRGKDIAA